MLGRGCVVEHSILRAGSRIGAGSVISQVDASAAPLVVGLDRLLFQVPVRIGAYSLDELTGAAGRSGTAEVQAYHGGSDWRDDYRQVATPAGSFDREGEVLFGVPGRAADSTSDGRGAHRR